MNKKYFCIIVFSLAATRPACAQINITHLTPIQLPKGISYKGHVVNAISWHDTLGNNLLIQTETGEFKSPQGQDETYRDAELYAYRYMLVKDTFQLVWKIADYIHACNTDIEARFIKNSTSVTDLDNNGISETWIMYKTICHGDVSPANMKIIMYEGKNKYSIRGRNRIEINEHSFEGGEMNLDPAFQNGNTLFKKYATDLWNKNILETWQ